MFQEIFENNNDAILVVDPAGDRVSQINASARKLFGLPETHSQDLKYAELASDARNALTTFTVVLTGPGIGWTGELGYKDNQGRPISAEVSAARINIEGKPHLVLNLREQTERHEAEQLMHEMQMLAGIGGWSVRLPSLKLSWTEQVYAIHEVPVGTPITLDQSIEFYHPDSRVLIQDAYTEGLEEGKAWDLELKLVTARGNEIWVRVLGQAQLIEGKVTRLWGAFQDITERVLNENKLRQSQERFRAIVEDQPEFVCRFLPDGRLTFVNQSFCRYFGKHAHQLLGRDFWKSMHKEDEQAINEHLASFDAENPLQMIEHRIKASDGELRWLRWSNRALFNDQGTLVEFQGCGTDITEMKHAELDRERLEEQLQQAQKMEAVGQLAGGIAHDFNNLLFVIGGYAEMAMMDVDDPIARQQIEEISKASQRAANLTSQLLAFSRRQVLQPRDLNFNELIDNLLDMIRRLIGEHIEVNFIPQMDLATIHADHANMEQVIVNLAVNARDTMTIGGVLTLRTETISFDQDFARRHPWARSGTYVHLSVSDSGEGMPPEVQERIFEPFFTTKEVGKGTGLGLSMVHGIVSQHGGHIGASSEMGEGTTFHIYLPAVGRRTLLQAIENVIDSPNGTETILLAEDEAMVRGLTAKILEKAGYTVIPARDGEDALTIFCERQDEIDLVLLDVIMPKKSGPTAREDILERSPDMRFLFISGYSADEVHSSHLLEQEIPLLQKPYASAELLQVVRALLDSRPIHDS